MKLFVALMTLVFSTSLWACPGCLGSDPRAEMWVVYSIGIFILLVYIPFFLLYRMIVKNRNAHLVGRELSESTAQGPSESVNDISTK